MTEIAKFRYPGAKNFTTEQAHLFMGRDDDKEKGSVKQVMLLGFLV